MTCDQTLPKKMSGLYIRIDLYIPIYKSIQYVTFVSMYKSIIDTDIELISEHMSETAKKTERHYILPLADTAEVLQVRHDHVGHVVDQILVESVRSSGNFLVGHSAVGIYLVGISITFQFSSWENRLPS